MVYFRRAVKPKVFISKCVSFCRDSWMSRDVTSNQHGDAELRQEPCWTLRACRSLAFLVTCSRGSWRNMTAWETERCSNRGPRSSTRSLRRQTTKPRACFCPGRWRKSSRIRRWRGASTASCGKPVRWRSVGVLVWDSALGKPACVPCLFARFSRCVCWKP